MNHQSSYSERAAVLSPPPQQAPGFCWQNAEPRPAPPLADALVPPVAPAPPPVAPAPPDGVVPAPRRASCRCRRRRGAGPAGGVVAVPALVPSRSSSSTLVLVELFGTAGTAPDAPPVGTVNAARRRCRWCWSASAAGADADGDDDRDRDARRVPARCRPRAASCPGEQSQEPSGSMRLPQSGQSLRSFCASWSHQLQNRRFSIIQGSSDRWERAAAARRRPPAAHPSRGRGRSRPARPHDDLAAGRGRTHPVLLAQPHGEPSYQRSPAGAPTPAPRRPCAREQMMQCRRVLD